MVGEHGDSSVMLWSGAQVGGLPLRQWPGLGTVSNVFVIGLSADFGLSTPDPGEAAVKSAIVRGARRVVVLADASKFGVESLVRFGQLDDVDILVTDEHPDAALADALDAAGVEVWLA